MWVLKFQDLAFLENIEEFLSVFSLASSSSANENLLCLPQRQNAN